MVRGGCAGWTGRGAVKRKAAEQICPRAWDSCEPVVLVDEGPQQEACKTGSISSCSGGRDAGRSVRGRAATDRMLSRPRRSMSSWAARRLSAWPLGRHEDRCSSALPNHWRPPDNSRENPAVSRSNRRVKCQSLGKAESGSNIRLASAVFFHEERRLMMTTKRPRSVPTWQRASWRRDSGLHAATPTRGH